MEKVRVDKTVISINYQVTCTSGVRTVCTPSVLWCSCSFKVIQGGYTLCVLSFWRVLELQFRIPFSLRFQTDQFRFIPRRYFFLKFSKRFFFSRNCGFQRNKGILKRLLEIPDSKMRPDWSIKPNNNSIRSISTPMQCVGCSEFHSRSIFDANSHDQKFFFLNSLFPKK